MVILKGENKEMKYYEKISSIFNSLNNRFASEQGMNLELDGDKEYFKFGLIKESFSDEKMGAIKQVFYMQDILNIDDKTTDYYIKIFSSELEKILGTISKENRILVVGMGNQYLIADGLGAEVIKNLEPTRHLKQNNIINNMPSISLFQPSVLGATGIETADTINAICGIVKPDFIIAVDSLCAVELHRFCSTIQVSTDGITPGAGIGNARKKIDRENTGSKVVAIGVPMLIRSGDISGCNEENLFNFQTIFTSANINDLVVKFAEIISKALSSLFLK